MTKNNHSQRTASKKEAIEDAQWEPFEMAPSYEDDAILRTFVISDATNLVRRGFETGFLRRSDVRNQAALPSCGFGELEWVRLNETEGSLRQDVVKQFARYKNVAYLKRKNCFFFPKDPAVDREQFFFELAVHAYHSGPVALEH